MVRAEERLTRLEEATVRAEERLTRLEEAMVRAEERLTRLEEAVVLAEERLTRLEEAMVRAEGRLTRLEEAMVRAEERLSRLEEAMVHAEGRLSRLEEVVQALAEAQLRAEERLGRLEGDMAHLKGWSLEWRYREKAPAYFGRLARKIHALSAEELAEILGKAVDGGLLSQDELDEILAADLVLRGLGKGGEEVWLVVEISWGIGMVDVERAKARAELLAKAGLGALPVVAGTGIAPEAAERARELGVWQVLDGYPISPN